MLKYIYNINNMKHVINGEHLDLVFDRCQTNQGFKYYEGLNNYDYLFIFEMFRLELKTNVFLDLDKGGYGDYHNYFVKFIEDLSKLEQFYKGVSQKIYEQLREKNKKLYKNYDKIN